MRRASILRGMSTATQITGVEALEQAAAVMYPPPPPRPGDTPPNTQIAELRKADPAREIYRPEDQYGTAVRDLALATNPGGNAAELEAQQAALANVMADLGMGRDDVSQLASFARRNTDKPPTKDELAAHQRTAVRTLREQYGAGFDDALKDAKALAARDPRFAAYLDRTGLGNDPWVFSRMAELGRSARARGQLK